MVNNSSRYFSAALGLLLAQCSQKAAPPPGYQGVVEFETSLVSFEAPGRIKDVPVHRGDVVKEGAILATLDDSLELLVRTTREDEVKSAIADLTLLQAGSRSQDVAALSADVKGVLANEDLAKKNLERTQKLLQAGTIPQAEADRSEAEYERAKQQRKSLEERLSAARQGARPEEILRAKARVALAQSQLDTENEKLTRFVLHASRTGNVVDVLVRPGELANVGTVAVTMADTSHPYVDVFLPQDKLGGVQVGAKAVLRVDATKAEIPAEVEYVSPQTEFTPRFLFSPQERPNLVIRVRMRIDDREHTLHAGVPAFAELRP